MEYDVLRVSKRLFVSEEAGHCEIPAIEGARYAEVVAQFIDASGDDTRLE